MKRTSAPVDLIDDAARQLGVARQTVLNQVRSGKRSAVHVIEGKRCGLRIEIHPAEPGLLDADALSSQTAQQPDRPLG